MIIPFLLLNVLTICDTYILVFQSDNVEVKNENTGF